MNKVTREQQRRVTYNNSQTIHQSGESTGRLGETPPILSILSSRFENSMLLQMRIIVESKSPLAFQHHMGLP